MRESLPHDGFGLHQLLWIVHGTPKRRFHNADASPSLPNQSVDDVGELNLSAPRWRHLHGKELAVEEVHAGRDEIRNEFLGFFDRSCNAASGIGHEHSKRSWVRNALGERGKVFLPDEPFQIFLHIEIVREEHEKAATDNIPCLLNGMTETLRLRLTGIRDFSPTVFRAKIVPNLLLVWTADHEDELIHGFRERRERMLHERLPRDRKELLRTLIGLSHAGTFPRNRKDGLHRYR